MATRPRSRGRTRRWVKTSAPTAAEAAEPPESMYGSMCTPDDHASDSSTVPAIRPPCVTDKGGEKARDRNEDGAAVPLAPADLIVRQVKASIAFGDVKPGGRLTSIRDLSKLTGASRSAVLGAYREMVTQGLAEVRGRSGFYLAEVGSRSRRRSCGADLGNEHLPWLALMAAERSTATGGPGAGGLPADWMPNRMVRAALREMAGDFRAYDADGQPPIGHEGLRGQIASRLRERGVTATASQVLLTDGAMQGLDLSCRLFVGPGEAVLVDDPCPCVVRAVLAANRARVVAIPQMPDGPDLDAVLAEVGASRPRLYVTSSGPSDPTGATVAPAKAHRLLRMAEEHDFVVVDDATSADLARIPGAPTLAAYDGLRRVVTIGGLSETVSAEVRCGYVAAAPRWIDHLLALKLATSGGNDHLAAELVHRVISGPGYDGYLSSLRRRIAKASADALHALRGGGFEPWCAPRAGMFVWARLPDGRDAAPIARRALARGLLTAPGEAFSSMAMDHMRFNVTRPLNFEVMRTLMDALSETEANP